MSAERVDDNPICSETKKHRVRGGAKEQVSIVSVMHNNDLFSRVCKSLE